MELDATYKAMLMSLQIATVCGYLLGSIPFGLVLTRMAGLGDIRQIGSGNIGATNVLRTGRKGLAFMTLVGDAGQRGVCRFVICPPLWPRTGHICRWCRCHRAHVPCLVTV